MQRAQGRSHSPIPQAAECILRIVEKANAPVIYLSTDAAESETNFLQSLVVFNDKQVPLVKRPEDALLYRNHMGGDNQVLRMNLDTIFSYEPNFESDRLTEQQSTFAMLVQVDAMLDKTICALSNVFIGSSGSTFTEDIFRLRRGWGSASHCDECTSARVSCPTT